MTVVTDDIIIRCYSDLKAEAQATEASRKVELFFAVTSDLASYYPLFRKWVSEREKERADKFSSDKERETYISVHGFLRLMLAKKIKSDPSEVEYSRGIYNKPGLQYDPLFFNISHTKNAFAIGISEDYQIGVDIEDMDRKIDMASISRTFFSRKELEFIMKSESDKEERFFLVWTRKEALLKAMGTGIIDDLNKIEVSGSENFLNPEIFCKNSCQGRARDHYVYSSRINGYILSIAMPENQAIDFIHLDSANIKSLLVQY